MDEARIITAFIGQTLEQQQAVWEPVYPLTAIAEGLGAPITPETLAAACDDAIELASTPTGLRSMWTLAPHAERDPRLNRIPAVAVMDRWRIGVPIQLWAASGPCRQLPAAYLAGFTFLDHDRGGEAREAKRRPAQATGWRAVWERWFPSRRDPVLRPQDRAMKKPPPDYFQQPDGGRFFPEPRHAFDPADHTPEII